MRHVNIRAVARAVRGGLVVGPAPALLPVVLVVVLAGCGGSERRAPGGVDAQTQRLVESLATHDTRLAQAEAKATAECMRPKGFRYPPYEVLRPRPAAAGPARLVHPISKREAAQHGYGDDLNRERPKDSDPQLAQEHYLNTLPEPERRRYHQALWPADEPEVTIDLPQGMTSGAASTGCVAEARIRVYGSVETYLRLSQFSNALSLVSIDAYDRSRNAKTMGLYGWCMKRAGYAVDPPKEAKDLARERFAHRRPDEVSDQERAMAVSDATCQESSGIYDRLEAAILDEASDWIRKHETDIRDWAERRRDSQRRAERILGP